MYYIISFYILLWHIIYHITLWYNIFHHFMFYLIVLEITLYYIFHCIALHCIVFYYIILYYFVIFYIISYYGCIACCKIQLFLLHPFNVIFYPISSWSSSATLDLYLVLYIWYIHSDWVLHLVLNSFWIESIVWKITLQNNLEFINFRNFFSENLQNIITWKSCYTVKPQSWS